MTDISPDPKVQPQAHAITMADLIRVFGRIGLMSFGGPAAQIALMHKELVEDRPWLSEAGFLRALSFCMMLPGPEAMQLATYAGWRLRGAPGGVLAGLLFVLPGALVIAALVFLYMNFGAQPLVQAGFLGIKAAVVAIVLQALQRLGKKALHGVTDLALAAFGFLALFLFALPFPLVLLTAALLGSLRVRSTENEPAALPPAAAGPVWVTLLLWGGLWLLPLGALSLFGPQLLADIGWFFAKLAVVTFGGAYAVLAYMSQTVVAQYQWIETGQMIDALGLAETTPGPLILVTQFVAMLAGALASGTWMALAAGLVALWATFMPCFLWIFLAAPHVERIASHPRLGAALRAITAVVVGVILNLSVWFLLHVLFRETVTLELPAISLMLPVMASLDISAALLVLAAPVVALACGGRLALILPIMAGLGIAMAQII
ncbi:putative chromate transporter [Phaeobacter inhibens]|uniref:chromate efflux transporter n=1 Tax=Phaeobacter inhibens TaxID=221822 RepID=UPI000C9BAA1D|nr:chromate efflux transporter [Phaeobacter inhibens]AUR03390.1 putative chromate transporter [Phaeobacter inhibens]